MTAQLQESLERATEGLVYSSESDRPFTFVRYPGASIDVSRLTPREIGSLAGALGAEVEETTLEELLARHIERVDALDLESQRLIPRYEALRDELRRSLGAVRVFRLGRTAVRCLVIGNDPETGELTGLQTVAIET